MISNTMKPSFLIALLLAPVSATFSQVPKLIEKVVKQGSQLVIPYEKYVLDNGLTVILTEDHSDPIVHVDVTYHVGSAREEIGHSGFAHFFEHMMFEGSDHVKAGEHFRLVTAAGGTLNGSTTRDRTNYFETVPSNQLQKMLWLESDRMGFLLGAVTQKKFENQRATVKNERGQNYDNRPYGLAEEAVSKVLYPYGHPYSWLTIGCPEDLNKVNVDDLKRFFLRWYGPNNATLTIGGDLNVKQTLAWVSQYFGSIPRGPDVRPLLLPSPELTADRYISYRDHYARLPLLYRAYIGVKMNDQDRAALDALAMIIGQGPNSILYQHFIKPGKAARAVMFTDHSELAGSVGIQIMPYAGQSLAAMQQLISESLADFEKRGVTEKDLARYKGTEVADFINALGSVSGKVSALAAAQTFTGTPNPGRQLADIQKLSRQDVMRVYEKYLKGKAAVVLSILPNGLNVAPAAPDDFKPDDLHGQVQEDGYPRLSYHRGQDHFDRSIIPPAGQNPIIKVPVYWTAKMDNGLRMIGSCNHEIPAVTMTFSIRGGGLMAASNPAKAGLPMVVAQMLNEDTQHLSREEFSARLEALGSEVDVSATADATVYHCVSLTKNIEETLALLRERMFHPKFSQQALDRIKKQDIEGLRISRTQPVNVANAVYYKILYGKNNIRVYGLGGTSETLNYITLEDVQDYYDRYFAPNLCSVVVAGDLPAAQASADLRFLQQWKVKEVAVPDVPAPEGRPEPKTIYYVDIPHAAQSEIRIGDYTGVSYDATGVFYRLGLMNYMLGGCFSSHLNMDLREDKGWTYGANSNFSSGKFGGTYTAQAGVRASATDSAVLEMVKVIRQYATEGISTGELAFTKNSIGQSEAGKYETNGQKASFLARIQAYELPANFTGQERGILNGLTKDEVDRLARQYLDTDQMSILVVGDKGLFLPGLRDKGYRLVELDADGNLKP
jgi:zinc protease